MLHRSTVSLCYRKPWHIVRRARISPLRTTASPRREIGNGKMPRSQVWHAVEQ